MFLSLYTYLQYIIVQVMISFIFINDEGVLGK